jgi:hypothetical protein
LFQVLQLAVSLEQQALLILAPTESYDGTVLLTSSEVGFGNFMLAVEDNLNLD